MDHIYEVNGVPFWSEEEIAYREYAKRFIASRMKAALLASNPAWNIMEIEGPILTPRPLVNQNYTAADIWIQADSDLVLRPETTPASYAFLNHILSHQAKPPICVWQAGKSFRREQDQVSKNMRLKEFYQQEFQCLFTADSLNDYHTIMVKAIEKALHDLMPSPTRVIPSDRLPDYSLITMDVEVDNGDKWMELASISKRKDFPYPVKIQTKKALEIREVLVVEVAVGLDRLVFNRFAKPCPPHP